MSDMPSLENVADHSGQECYMAKSYDPYADRYLLYVMMRTPTEPDNPDINFAFVSGFDAAESRDDAVARMYERHSNVVSVEDLAA